ncbi:MAG TPA: winged helix-turn-helix domain-containing protein [Bryobacteraceae bacterium]|nr:winged helix-turn-helix domain-containing protein [Bryobacteraceae bacterium]
MPNQQSHLYSFGSFRLDAGARVLTSDGKAVTLAPKTFDLLVLLVRGEGRLMDKRELMLALWPDTIVEEANLSFQVSILRKALQSNGHDLIETVPKHGYRFTAPAEHLDPPGTSNGRSPEHTKALPEIRPPASLQIQKDPTRQARRGPLFAAVVALAVVAGGGYWLGKRFAAPLATSPKAVKLSVLPPPGFAIEGAASRQSFALSPDGTRLAFTAMDSSGAFSVFLRDLDSLEPRLLPGTESTHTLFWAPDGQSLYVTAKGKLSRIPLEGDARVLLADSPPFMFSGTWLSSGRLFLDSYRGSYLVSPSGGPLDRLKEIYSWPEVLPGGEHLLYVRWDARAGRYRARALRLADFSTMKDLIETDSRVRYSASLADSDTGYLLYVRGGSLLASPFDPRSLQVTGEAMSVASGVYSFAKTGAADFSVSDTGAVAYRTSIGRSQLVWVDRSGRQLATIGPANINVKSARLSPDGQRVATAIYAIERGEQDLWVFDIKTNSGRRLTADLALRDSPVWSPDSTKLAFLHTADSEPPRVHVRGLGENDAEESMPAADFQIPGAWSPDGRFLAFTNTGFPRSENEQQGDVWMFDLAQGRKSIPLLNTRFHEAHAVFSPDGKWLAFTSNESGRAELYIQAFRSGDDPGLIGERYLVSAAGAQAVRWRRDGKELFYLGFDGRVQAVPLRLSPKPEFGRAAALFTISTEARAAIHSMLGFDVSADGQRFLIPVVTSPASPLVIVQNWEALLPHKSQSVLR